MTRPPTARLPARSLAATLAVAVAMTPAGAAPGRDAETAATAPIPPLVTAAVASRETTAPAPVRPPVDPQKILPSDCRFEIGQGRDSGTWYGRQCLVANFAHWPFLPDHCERRLDLPRRRQDIAAYDATCLARFGFGPDDGVLGIRH